MLHLLPIRLMLNAILSVALVAVFGVSYYGWIEGGTAHNIQLALRIAPLVVIGLFVFFTATWRWLPPVQRMIFPYLGGQWSGIINFKTLGGEQQKPVTLEVKHNLLKVRLILESNESTSHTIVTHAQKDQDFDRYRLYYVYLNQRKEGAPKAGEQYTGIAVMRIEDKGYLELVGDYFTETHRHGTLSLTRDAKTRWWKLWC